MTISEKKTYTVKDWFANKIANEIKMNINMCDVFAVLKETEKAVYAMLNLGCDRKKTMWVPKSVLVEGDGRFGTLITDSYDDASEQFSIFWESYK